MVLVSHSIWAMYTHIKLWMRRRRTRRRRRNTYTNIKLWMRRTRRRNTKRCRIFVVLYERKSLFLKTTKGSAKKLLLCFVKKVSTILKSCNPFESSQPFIKVATFVKSRNSSSKSELLKKDTTFHNRHNFSLKLQLFIRVTTFFIKS